jgi:arylsulfatase A-like enzyme
VWNISVYHRGMMGGSTPNIDRLAKEGMIFMDHYAQASCTAGRAAFITGQYPIRVGLSIVGLPGAPQGMSTKDLWAPSGLATMPGSQRVRSVALQESNDRSSSKRPFALHNPMT